MRKSASIIGKRDQRGETTIEIKTAPPRGSKKAYPASVFRRSFGRQPVWVRARPLLPFGHATIKTGFAMPRPIASKPPRRLSLENNIPF
jgi:hypothetical protein